MKKIKSEIDASNILSQKRNRVTSIEGVLSIITSQQFEKDKGSFTNKKTIPNKKKVLKPKMQKVINKIKAKVQISKPIVNKQNKVLPKPSKKIRRKMIEKTLKQKEKASVQTKTMSTPKNNGVKQKSKQESTRNKTRTMEIEQKIPLGLPSGMELERLNNAQKLKTIHIMDPKRAESYLKILQEHLGLELGMQMGMGMGIPPQILLKAQPLPLPPEVNVIKIEDED